MNFDVNFNGFFTNNNGQEFLTISPKNAVMDHFIHNITIAGYPVIVNNNRISKMKKIHLTINQMDFLNNLVGNCKNQEAVAFLKTITKKNCFFVDYTNWVKYAPIGYGHQAIIFNNSSSGDIKVFSYFLANIDHA